jgi:O-antigen biosynthesis protein
MLEWTGERFLPWIRGSTTAYEHLHRYAYAATLVKNKHVLDLACGEGYGSNILAVNATSVVGIDIDEGVVRHASAKYGSSRLRFLSGPITAVPIPETHSFDAIVCFEAIEHIDNHEALLGEVKRLLKPDGLFIVSTPNKAIYHDEARDENPFHVKELYFEEFRDLLARYFQNVQFLGQRIHPGSTIWPLGAAAANGFQEFLMERRIDEFEFIGSDKRVPLYFIAIACNAPVSNPSPPASILTDESDSLIVEKDQATEWRSKQVLEQEKTISSLQEAVKWREGQIDELTEGLQWTQNRANDLEKTIASQASALAWRAQQVSELETGKEYWERQSKLLTSQLHNTQHQLAVASDTLTGIYSSRGWKLIMKLRRIRDAFRRSR